MSALGVPLDSVSIAFSERARPRGNRWDFTARVSWKRETTSEQSSPEDQVAASIDDELNFNFQGPATSFTKAISQQSYNPSGSSDVAPEVGKAVGVRIDGTVDGLEVSIPSNGFNLTRTLRLGNSDAQVNGWMMNRIAKLHSKNQATYRGHQAGDCFFKSFSGQFIGDYSFRCTFDFASQFGENNPTVEIGSTTFNVGQRVKGFDVLWAMYNRKLDDAANMIAPSAAGVYVAEVFKDSDFASLIQGV